MSAAGDRIEGVGRTDPVATGRPGSGDPYSVVMVGPYPLDPAVISNGVEAVVVYLADGLKGVPRIRLEVISCTDAVFAETVRDWDGVRVHYLPSTRRWRNITFDVINGLRIRRKILALRPDLIHLHNHQLVPFLQGVRGDRVLATVHGLVFEEAKYDTESWDWLRRPPRRLLERFALRRSRDLLAVSEYVRRAIEPFTPARVTVIDNPVEKRYFELGENPARESSAACSVLFVGMIMYRKNILALIQAVEQVRAEAPEVQLRIVGGVQHRRYQEELGRYVADRGLERTVHFLGRLARRDLLAEYARCSIVASASHEETAGMIFQQAMAAGKPVVGMAVGGVPDIVRHDETGLLVPAGDVTRFAAALRQLVHNPELRTRMGNAGRHMALQRFTSAIVAARTVAVYDAILDREPHHAPKAPA